jgi:hypothetical protein
MLIGGLLALGAKHRTAGLIWFVVGTLLTTTPDIMAVLGVGGSCGPGLFR